MVSEQCFTRSNRSGELVCVQQVQHRCALRRDQYLDNFVAAILAGAIFFALGWLAAAAL